MAYELHKWIATAMTSAVFIGAVYAGEQQPQLLDDDRDGVQSPAGVNQAEPAVGPGQAEAERNRDRGMEGGRMSEDSMSDGSSEYNHDVYVPDGAGTAGTMKEGAGQGGSGSGS